LLPLLVSLCAALFPGPAYPQTTDAGKAPGSPGEAAAGVWIIPIRGDIEPSLAAFVRREARKALSAGARFIVFEIDTFGGRVDSALQITSFIVSIKEARTVAWVTNSDSSMGVSWSAGALIALACNDIYMASGTSMGAAAPVSLGADGSAEPTGEKTVAALRSQMAALAELNGHPVGIALAMVDYDVELWEVSVEGRREAVTLAELERLEKEVAGVERLGLISPGGKLLSLSSGEAYRYGLCAAQVESREELLGALGAAAERVHESVPSFTDSLISFLSSGTVQVLLIVLGLVMIFLEINTPGFGIFGVAAILAFVTVFGAGALLGKVGSTEIILFLLGLALLAVEIFLLPGFGIAGISGIILIGFSLLLSMQDFIIPRLPGEWDLLGRNAVVVVLGIIAAITGIAVIALLGPKIRIFDGLTLKTRITGTANGPLRSDGPIGSDGPVAAGSLGDAEGLPAPEEDGDYRALIGKGGIAATTLRPTGRAEIDGRFYTVEGEGTFIEQGEGIRVIRVRGNRIIVSPS
jgi:membrane-bound serine protease (ClpP class)